MSGSLSTRFTLKQRFKWGKISTSTLKNAILSHLFTLYVILQKEYAHSFGSKCLIRVGLHPLVFVKICVSSGPAPTRFRKSLHFEWACTHSFFVKAMNRVGRLSVKTQKILILQQCSYIICNFAKGVCPLVRIKMLDSSGPAPTRFQVFPAFEWGIIPLVYVILIKIPSLPAEPVKRARIKRTVSLFHELRSRSNDRRNVLRGRSRLHDCGCHKYVLLSADGRDDCTLHLDHIRGFPTGDLLQPYPPLP